MDSKCAVCGKNNGSCNHYLLANNVELVICPGCLAFSLSELAKMARTAHKENRLLSQKGEQLKIRKTK